KFLKASPGLVDDLVALTEHRQLPTDRPVVPGGRRPRQDQEVVRLLPEHRLLEGHRVSTMCWFQVQPHAGGGTPDVLLAATFLHELSTGSTPSSPTGPEQFRVDRGPTGSEGRGGKDR